MSGEWKDIMFLLQIINYLNKIIYHKIEKLKTIKYFNNNKNTNNCFRFIFSM